MIPAKAMTKTERGDLCRLIRQRERLAKAAAAQRAAELRSDFEKQLMTEYHFDQDEVWRKARAVADKAVKAAQAEVEARCKELGIPSRFAPGIQMYWYKRGENGSRERREELRRFAMARINTAEKTAKVEIERHSVELQSKVIAEGLTSESARNFLDQLPSVETLMPALDIGEVKQLLGPSMDGAS